MKNVVLETAFILFQHRLLYIAASTITLCLIWKSREPAAIQIFFLLSIIKQTTSKNALILYESLAGNLQNLTRKYFCGKQLFLLGCTTKLTPVDPKRRPLSRDTFTHYTKNNKFNNTNIYHVINHKGNWLGTVFLKINLDKQRKIY